MSGREQARGRATAKLREIEDPSVPLRLHDEPVEYPWCWVFGFNTQTWFRTGSFTDGAVSGPIVVDKDGGDVWVAPSAPPLERWLNQHAAERGLTPVPVPEPGNPFG